MGIDNQISGYLSIRIQALLVAERAKPHNDTHLHTHTGTEHRENAEAIAPRPGHAQAGTSAGNEGDPPLAYTAWHQLSPKDQPSTHPHQHPRSPPDTPIAHQREPVRRPTT